MCLLLNATLGPLEAASGQEPRRAEITVPAAVEEGTNPGVMIRGVEPGTVVRLHALQSLQRWKEVDGNWIRIRQPLHAYADFAVAADGTVRVDEQTPVRGTYSKADPLGLLWSGRRFEDPALDDVRSFPPQPLDAGPEQRVQLALERDGEILAEAAFQLVACSRPVTVSEHRGKDWHAVFARPKDGRDLPVVISLHGSEGGSVDKARSRALPIAARGFAVVALNYFAYPHEAIAGVPQQHSEIRVELLAEVRDWIRTQPEVSSSGLRLIGTSKGAEFALLAAANLDWVTCVVAVVPTDIVWEGYSASGSVGTGSSSWSLGGSPVPFVPLFPFDPAQEGLYRTNTERYERSRAHFAERANAARIPIENSKARILRLASDRDEVWASGDMARNLVEQMTLAGAAQRVQVRIYPRAGHMIAGTGTFPVRLYGEDSADPAAKDLTAEGEAAADAWRRTLRFLAE